MQVRGRQFCILFIAIMFLIPNSALSTLMPITSGGEPLVFDDVTGLYWQADLRRHIGKDLGTQINDIISVDNVSYYGLINTWEMANHDEVIELFSSITEDNFWFPFSFSETYYGPNYFAWVGRTITPDPANPGFTFTPMYDASPVWPDPNLEKYPYLSLPANEPFPPFSQTPPLYVEAVGAWVKSEYPPVPEPATLLLLGTGLAGFAGFRRKFKKSNQTENAHLSTKRRGPQ